MNIEKFYQENALDKNFDYIFYQKLYPDVINYYQPHCRNNDISEAHRLYYHWYNHGRDMRRFKNQTEVDNFHQPNISLREKSNTNKRLAILTTYFNPCNYQSKKNNYEKFSNHIKQFGDLYPVELSLNDEFFIRDSNCIRIKGSEKNILWQKEALLNIGLDNLPKNYDNIAWIDCDVLFTDPSWIEDVDYKLQEYKIIQLFSSVCRLKPDNSKTVDATSKCYCLPNRNIAINEVSGYAWAGRREVLDKIRFLDNQILGMGDTIMAKAFNGEFFPGNLDTQQKTKQWYEKTQNIVDKSFSYIDTEILHLYHGKESNRKYSNRYEEIMCNNNYYDIVYMNSDKIWEFMDSADEKVKNNIFNYFNTRLEDEDLEQ